MGEVIQADDGSQRGHDLNAWAVLRYSVIFAAITVPASFVLLGFPAILLATWIIARQFADRYRRQMAARETFYLALASWAWLFVAAGLKTVLLGVAPLLLFQLPWEAVTFVTVWAAYVWLARYVIRRKLRVEADTTQPRSPQATLAQQEERYAEATARSLTLGVAWLSVGLFGILGVVLLVGIVAVALALLGIEVGTSFIFFATAVSLPVLMGAWAYFIQRKTAGLFPSHKLVLWLRRFHRADLMEFPFPSFLERVCRGVAVPITLQDSTVVAARTAAELRPAFHVLRAVMGAAWFALFLSSIELLQSGPGFDLETALRGIVPALALAALISIPFVMPNLGVVRLGTKRGQRLVQRLTDAIESGSDNQWNDYGKLSIIVRMIAKPRESPVHRHTLELAFGVLIESADADIADALSVQGCLLR